MKHYSVLKNEAIEGLALKEDGIYVDATLGYAGDASSILKSLKGGYLFAFDKDNEALKYSDDVLKKIGSNYTLIHSDFVNMASYLENYHIKGVDGILFDLGVSSPQLDEDRGFSFMRDEILDMRMDKSNKVTARRIVNEWSKDDLINIFFQYGEEKLSKEIASKIACEREKKEIVTTSQLVEVIKQAVGANYFFKNHPERNIFQAIRIAVNDELASLEKILPIAIDLLNKKGRLVVITFHSLEDRIVKKVFKKYSEVDPILKGLPEIPLDYQPKIKIINKKVILPSKRELEENSRSKSAKLRIVERI